MPLVDSHCHLQDSAFDADRGELLSRSLETLDWLVVIGDDAPTSRAAVDLTQPGVYTSVGIHPYHAATADAPALQDLRELAQSPHVVAIGEIGLDYYKHNDTPRDIQQSAFQRQLQLATSLNLPVIIHNRESEKDLAAIVDAHHSRLAGGVMHCFAGSTAFVERALSWGFYISFAGNVTFPKAEELRAAARAVPLDRLLIETDAPYLAPQPVRGKRCEPAFVQYTAQHLAQLKGVPLETFCAATTENAARLFSVSL